MWLLKLKLKHDCIIGNRCQKYSCISLGYPLEYYNDGKDTYYLHFEKIIGNGDNVTKFLKDLKNDKNVHQFEAEGNSVFFSYKAKKGIMPAQLYIKKIFYVKPIKVDTDGYEYWEVASWSRENINEFIKNIKRDTKNLQEFKILNIKKTKLSEIYFPQIMPLLTKNQENAFSLAIKEGYYEFPREIKLEKLAKIMKISLSTYREHLRKAEKKIMPILSHNI